LESNKYDGRAKVYLPPMLMVNFISISYLKSYNCGKWGLNEIASLKCNKILKERDHAYEQSKVIRKGA